MQASSRSRSGRRYPRHGPLVGEATEEGSYTLRCLACGVKGPEREDTLKAKLAFEETFVANDCYSPTYHVVKRKDERRVVPRREGFLRCSIRRWPYSRC